ncbi:MAG: hypothetical protein FLDDKLPJ_01586 [Phycisphaerae bacterium]|nr:hypothetical protein [Phycisphaerae bacterium]
MEKGISLFSPYVGMALILRNKEGAESALRNGTISFLHTGVKKLLITNSHVIDAFEHERRNNPAAILAVTCGSEQRPLDISSACVVRELGVDLAVLEFPDTHFIERIEKGGKHFYRPGGWPPPRPSKGDIVFLVGFPELHREVSKRGLECRLTAICDFVSSVSDRQVMLVDEQLERRIRKANPHLADFGSLSGMSGCMAFYQKSGQQDWNVCGFVYEAGGDGHKASICINHADFIRDDGSLDKTRMPWL